MAIELGCTQFEEAVSEYIEGGLTPDVALAMRRHAHQCPACAELLEEVRQTLGLLADLPELEMPRHLEARILQRTLAPREVLGWGATLAALVRGLMQPRFVLGFSMAVFAFALMINAAGVNLAHLRWADLAPAQVSARMHRSLNRGVARGVAYYNDLRVVYEIQAALHQMRQGDTSHSPNGRDRSERNRNQPQPSFLSGTPAVAALFSGVGSDEDPGKTGIALRQGAIFAAMNLVPQIRKPLTTAPHKGLWTDSTKDGRPSEEI